MRRLQMALDLQAWEPHTKPIHAFLPLFHGKLGRNIRVGSFNPLLDLADAHRVGLHVQASNPRAVRVPLGFLSKKRLENTANEGRIICLPRSVGRRESQGTQRSEAPKPHGRSCSIRNAYCPSAGLQIRFTIDRRRHDWAILGSLGFTDHTNQR